MEKKISVNDSRRFTQLEYEGNKLLRNRDFEGARSIYSALICEFPNNHLGYAQTAAILQTDGNFRESFYF